MTMRKLPARVRIADIITHAARIFEVTEATVKSASRRQEAVHCRAAIAVVARAMPRPPSYPMIGRHLGGRDHSTITHAVEKAATYADFALDFAERLDALFDAVEAFRPFAQDKQPRARDTERWIAKVLATAPPVDTAAQELKPRNRFLSGDDALVDHRLDMRAGSLALADAINGARVA
jgi:hypothetical protein